MPFRTGVGVLTALLLCCGLAVLGASASASTAQQGAKAFTIRSSLDGKAVLPRRIRWIAHTSAPVLFPRVEFLIDGSSSSSTGPVQAARRDHDG